MHPKTRYNIKVAEKHNVQIVEDNSQDAFETYWKLTEETTHRQQFFAHTKKYHERMWHTLQASSIIHQSLKNNELQAHYFLAKYTQTPNRQLTTLAAWVLFTFHDTL